VNRVMDEMSLISLGRIEGCKARMSYMKEEAVEGSWKDGSAVE
jgi:hypothetical protein